MCTVTKAFSSEYLLTYITELRAYMMQSSGRSDTTDIYTTHYYDRWFTTSRYQLALLVFATSQ